MRIENIACALVVILLPASTTRADVFNLGPGQTSLEFVTVGNPGNSADDTGFGGVNYEYRIGKFEITVAQYAEFLNAVAAADTYGLYNTEMVSIGIQRSGSSGTFVYSLEYDFVADLPVNIVSWGDAVRFCNWLHNGQPNGMQVLGTTEDGAYYLNGAVSDTDLMAVSREVDALYYLPDLNEWYKAAYHMNDGSTGNYYVYPTGDDSVPGTDTSEVTNPGNNANYNAGLGNWLTRVGDFELSDSPYGTYDQGGNIKEMLESQLGASYRVRVGGNFFKDSSEMASFNCGTQCGHPTAEWGTLGFRVAAAPVPEPTTLAIWSALGGLGMMIAARRRRTA